MSFQIHSFLSRVDVERSDWKTFWKHKQIWRYPCKNPAVFPVEDIAQHCALPYVYDERGSVLVVSSSVLEVLPEIPHCLAPVLFSDWYDTRWSEHWMTALYRDFEVLYTSRSCFLEYLRTLGVGIITR